MEQPKYKIGDTVWMMGGNKPSEYQIKAIVLVRKDPLYAIGSVISYLDPKTEKKREGWWAQLWVGMTGATLKTTAYDEEWHTLESALLEESHLFPTKESLIDSL